MTQNNSEILFNPAFYEFKWTDDNWYRWDKRTAHRMAKMERDTLLKKFLREGSLVKAFDRKNQEVVLGGEVGGNKLSVTASVTVYGIKFLGS
jgi:hypothetical protein